MNYEHALLGCIIIEPNAGMYACKDKNITVDSFADFDCRVVYSAIDKLSKLNKPIDVVTVENALSSPIGISTTVLLDEALTVTNVGHYADEVKSAERRRTLARMLSVGEEAISQGEGTDDIISSLQAQIIELTDSSGVKALKLGDTRESKIEQWKVAQESGFVGIPFHLPSANAVLGGLRRKCMSIIGAYRGEGKSTLARDWALHSAKSGFKVALFSLEDPADIASASIVGNHAGINVFGLDTGLCNPHKLEQIDTAWKEVADLPLWIMSGAMSIDTIFTTAKLLKMKHGLDLVIIDHIQYIPPYIMKGMSRNDTVAHYSGVTTMMADSLDCHVCNMSQFSRGSEKEQRRPRISDLRDSGTLEQDARQIMLLYYDGERGHHVIGVEKNNYGKSGKDVAVERMDGKQRFADNGEIPREW